MGTYDFNSRGASTRPSAKPAFSSPDDVSEVHFSDTRKVAIDQRDADDRPLTASYSPRLLGVSCLDAILVGIRPRESLSSSDECIRLDDIFCTARKAGRATSKAGQPRRGRRTKRRKVWPGRSARKSVGLAAVASLVATKTKLSPERL